MSEPLIGIYLVEAVRLKIIDDGACRQSHVLPGATSNSVILQSSLSRGYRLFTIGGAARKNDGVDLEA
jgi:hypothetical protein